MHLSTIELNANNVGKWLTNVNAPYLILKLI